MTRILLTGMCSVQDRAAFHADESGVYYRSFVPTVKTKEDLIRSFNLAANTGNYLITEGAYRALEQHKVEYVPFWYIVNNADNPSVMERLRHSYDVCVFVTANILNADFRLDNEVRFLKAWKKPVALMSIGVQRRTDLESQLHASAKEFVELLKRQDIFSFTRGTFAAQFLRSQGVDNVIDACCPSAFNYSKNITDALSKLKSLDIRDIDNIWMTGYAGKSPDAAAEIQSLSSIAKRISYVCQDEPLLFDILANYNDDVDLYDETTGQITGAPTCDVPLAGDRELSWFAFFSPEQWRASSASIDVSIGHRFHGGLVALHAGTPAVFIAHDDRVTEMLTSAGLPYISPALWRSNEDKAKLVAEFLRDFDLHQAQDTYQKKEEIFRADVARILG